ncbi:hypothetical protein E2542_SST16677 [Spatholobus suberectus]|nr:hypothetical protein E2542_SST16677 [Spatholobus suberectus]
MEKSSLLPSGVFLFLLLNVSASLAARTAESVYTPFLQCLTNYTSDQVSNIEEPSVDPIIGIRCGVLFGFCELEKFWGRVDWTMVPVNLVLANCYA